MTFFKRKAPALFLLGLFATTALQAAPKVVTARAETGAFQGKYDRIALEGDVERNAKGQCFPSEAVTRISPWFLTTQSLASEPGWIIIRLRAQYRCL